MNAFTSITTDDYTDRLERMTAAILPLYLATSVGRSVRTETKRAIADAADVLRVMDELSPEGRIRAAAPTLLAALNRVQSTVEHYYHTNPDPDGSHWEDVKAMRDAIELATGEPACQ